MIDNFKFDIKGHLKIKDLNTGDMIVDKPNAIHYGNISTKLAEAFIGKPSSFITYMAFGNGGVTIDGTGIISYKTPNVDSTKVPTAQLYNTTFIYEITNYNSDGQTDLNRETNVGNGIGSFEDIEIRLVLDKDIPDTQMLIDQGNVVNDESEFANTEYVFNEIALYTGLKNKGNIIEQEQIQDFVNSSSDDDPTMITHVVFHPVQKSANRSLEITYILRIQMGT